MLDPFLVMIVDDNADNRFVLRTILARMEGLEIIEATSGMEALLRTVDREVHLILLDVQMPEMDGFETASHLQMTARTREIPIVFLTAVFKAEAFVQRGFDLGAVDYLTKPIDQSLLQNRVRLYQHLHEREMKLVQAMELLRLQDQALGAALDQANAANFAKGTFLANMSHEIRTPMNAIIGMTHLVLQTSLTPKQQQYLERTHTAANALLGIINDILDFSKIEAGKLLIGREAFLLEEVLEKAAHLVALKAAEKGVELILDQAFDVPPALVGDPLRLGQVLTNLLTNAVKFTERGEILIGVRKLWEEGDQVKLQFSVRDTGIGMTADQARQLFMPFSQVDPSSTRRFAGTGLGLAICKHLVTMMGGDIWVESRPGEGSEFCFSVGLTLGEAQGAVASQPSPGLKILVVEENAQASRVLKTLLTRAGHEPFTAASAGEAQELLRHAACDLVLMACSPSSREELQAAREIMAGGALPVILMVATETSGEAQQACAGDFLDRFIAKPVTGARLLAVIARVFGQEAPPRPSPAPREDSPAGLDGLRGGRVLLVEDNEFNQQVGMELLALLGLQVTLARNGQEAVAMVHSEAFDAVLMDLQMPVMDGYEATTLLRRDPALAALPILAMTAHAMQQEQDRCRMLGMNDYITKPIDPDLLARTLARWVRPAAKASAPENQAPPAPGDLPGLDWAAGLASFMGKRELYERMLKRFLELNLDNGQVLREAWERGDLEVVSRQAHSMASAAGTVGARDLAAVARDLDKALRLGGTREAIQEGVSRYEASVAEVTATLRARYG